MWTVLGIACVHRTPRALSLCTIFAQSPHTNRTESQSELASQYNTSNTIQHDQDKQSTT